MRTDTPQLDPRLGLYLVPHSGPFLIHCPRPGCSHRAKSVSEGGAIRLLARHLVQEHMTEPKGDA